MTGVSYALNFDILFYGPGMEQFLSVGPVYKICKLFFLTITFKFEWIMFFFRKKCIVGNSVGMRELMC